MNELVVDGAAQRQEPGSVGVSEGRRSGANFLHDIGRLDSSPTLLFRKLGPRRYRVRHVRDLLHARVARRRRARRDGDAGVEVDPVALDQGAPTSARRPLAAAR